MSEASPRIDEAFRRSIMALTQCDFDGATALYAPDAVWDGSATGVGVFKGRAAIRGFFEDWRHPYEDYEQAIEDFRDLGNGTALAVLTIRARLNANTAWVEYPHARVLTWSDGLIQHVTIYTDIDEARADAERLAEERG